MTTVEMGYTESDQYEPPVSAKFVLDFVRSNEDPGELVKRASVRGWSSSAHTDVYALAQSLLQNQNDKAGDKASRLNYLIGAIEPYLDSTTDIEAEKIAYCANVEGSTLILVAPGTEQELDKERFERYRKASELCGKCAVTDTCFELGEEQAQAGEIWGGHIKRGGRLIPLRVAVGELARKNSVKRPA